MSTALHRSNSWPSEPPHVDLEGSALTRHTAFWKPLATTDDRSRRLDVINKLLDLIHQEYGQRYTQRLDAPGHVSVVHFTWHSMDVTVRFELHNEIVSLAIYIHAKGTNHTDDVANNIIDSFANLRSIIDGSKSRRSLYDVHSFLYNDVWNQFFADKKIRD